ncbi:MAG: hypothetical protein D6690_13470 [Nitrospirae bacterium]|nr:MAG: hypothetical protein D6690_13470 [Nitrospirota bacterium]
MTTESPRMPSPQSLLFFADVMLGKLARWLRLLGYDTAYERDIDDRAIVERIVREGRWLLTRDRYLLRRNILAGRATLIVHDSVGDQLQQLGQELGISLVIDQATESRCMKCNAPLEPLAHRQAASRVPPHVAREQTEFVICPRCERIFWPGSHWTHLQRRLHDWQLGVTLGIVPRSSGA